MTEVLDGKVDRTLKVEFDSFMGLRILRVYTAGKVIWTGVNLDTLQWTETTTSGLEGLVSDWQANGNSTALGDPCAEVWHKAAAQLLNVLKGEQNNGN